MEPADIGGRIRSVAAQSELIRAVEAVAPDGGIRFALGNDSVRSLSPAEIQQLEQLGNRAEDWRRVRVAEPFDPSRVRHCEFYGDVTLGRFSRRVALSPGLEVPSGLVRSTVADCVIGHDALVRNVGLLARMVLAPETIVSDCGSISCQGPTSFGNGQELPIAIETGGREVAIFAEIDVEIARSVAVARSQRQRLEEYASAIADYARRCKSSRGIVERGASIRHTPVVRNVYLGPGAHVEAATALEECTILSSADEPVHIQSGAFVRRSLVQWGCHVETMAIVDSSVLTEHSHVERHGKVTASILGPNTGVAEGEVTASLLGPFVGFHHQALLIAALWPEGKGNVGYGANVGSNHTSKAPDQEFWPGEGTFFGLGVNIKYPADLTRSPYSIVASGVTTLPQKVSFPFSLINNPAAPYDRVSPAYNEIAPAWLLTDNMFALKRNEGKYKARNKAKRTAFDFDVFRPEIIDLMIDAGRRLRSVHRVLEVYTDRDIEGLGKNYMLESRRKPAIEAYDFYVQYYALLGLLAKLRGVREPADIAAAREVLAVPSDDSRWEHQRHILYDGGSNADVVDRLVQLRAMLERVARDVEQSKAKDDERGSRIIDDYADVHTLAARDKFVQQTWTETRRTQHEIDELVALLQSHR
jgi:hypothetical protein